MPTLLKVFRDAKKRNQGTISKDAGGSGPQQATASETWKVIYNGIVELSTVYGATLGTTATTLPHLGGVYGGMYCTRVNPVRSAESPYAWEVSVDYSTRQQPTGTSTTNNWNINLKRGSVAREETATKDRLGLPLWNTANDLLPQLPNVTLYDELLTITYSTSVVPTWADANYEGKTNSDSISFTICGVSRSFTAGQMKCTALPLNCTRTQTGVDGSGYPIYTVHYDVEMSFQIRKPKWIWKAPNEGFRGFAADGTTKITFTDYQTPRTQPTKLDVDGKEVTGTGSYLILPDDGDPSDYPAGSFEIEEQAAFTSLFVGLRDSEQHP